MDRRGTQRRFQLRDASAIERLRPRGWLINGLIHTRSTVVLYGPPGGGKTFIALDWSFCIATGRPWHGRPVKQGPVVYAAGEGSGGLKVRILAWKQSNGHEGLAGVQFVTEAVLMLQPGDVEGFLVALRTLPKRPVMIVVDTLARCMVGGDEDSARDRGLFVDAADRIRRRTGATVVIIHHPGKKSDQERGSSALRGAVDTLISLRKSGDLKRSGDHLTLECEKQKDAEPFRPIHLKLKTVRLARDSSSCAIAPGKASSEAPALGDTESGMLDALVELCSSAGQPVEAAEWRNATSPAPPSERTFYRHSRWLVAEGYVEQPTHGRYLPSPKGTATAKRLPQAAMAVASRTAATATPPVRGVQAERVAAKLASRN